MSRTHPFTTIPAHPLAAARPATMSPRSADAHGAAPVDHEHAAEAGLGDELRHEDVVLVTAHRRHVALEGQETAVLTEREQGDVGVRALVEEVGRRGHRASIRRRPGRCAPGGGERTFVLRREGCPRGRQASCGVSQRFTGNSVVVRRRITESRTAESMWSGVSRNDHFRSNVAGHPTDTALAVDCRNVRQSIAPVSGAGRGGRRARAAPAPSPTPGSSRSAPSSGSSRPRAAGARGSGRAPCRDARRR